MFCAMVFFPSSISLLMIFVASIEPNLGSGSWSWAVGLKLRGMETAYFLGRFAPYFERDWERSSTGPVSSDPRRMW